MTIQVSTTDARTAKALALLSGADRWLKLTRKTDGVRFYVVPGSNGKVYWTNLHECTCPDHTNRGVACKHMTAVALHLARVRAAQRRPAACSGCAGTTSYHKATCGRPREIDCPGCIQEASRRRAGGRRLSPAERSPHTCIGVRVPLVGRLSA